MKDTTCWVDGVPRAFADLSGNAFAAARELKRLNPTSIVEIRERSSGRKLMMLPDGRTH
jgi:hypothetical protein